jgi:L-alanine-DL-glutamate epimerase-like enolase superfamily enzyme
MCAAAIAWDRLRTLGEPITRIETFVRGSRLGFVRVTTAGGQIGWGQVSPFQADISATLLHRLVAPHFLDSDPGHLPGTIERCLGANLKFPGTFLCRALGGVDTACWDLLGRRAGLPVSALLGAGTAPVPVYGSSLNRSLAPEKEASRMADLRDRLGIRAFKTRVGDRAHPGLPGSDRPDPRSRELIPTLRRHLGPDATLMADANSRLTEPEARQLAGIMAEHAYAFFEEPLPYWDWQATARLREAIAVPIALGEQHHALGDWRRMIAAGALDVAQPDIGYLGGFTRALQVAGLAHAAGLTTVAHSANRSWNTVFAAHFLRVVPNPARFLEFSIEDGDRFFEEASRPILRRDAIRDGCLHPPEGPGWGLEPAPAWLDAADHEVSLAET